MLGRVGGLTFCSRFQNGMRPNQKLQIHEIEAEAVKKPEIAPLEKQGTFNKIGSFGEKERKYQDGSSDPGVSMKMPTALNKGEALSRVSSHEREHVVREQTKAKQEGREVVMQTVQIHSAICPECGRPYISGGKTRTVTKEKTERTNQEIGKLFDRYV